MAKYLCGILAATGHAAVHMVPLSDKQVTLTPNASRIKFYPLLNVVDKARVLTVPVSDYDFTTSAVLPASDVIIVCVNRTDSEEAWKRIGKLKFDDDHKAAIFCLQRGLLNFAHVTDAAEALGKTHAANQNVVVLSGVAAFSVIPHPETYGMFACSGRGDPTIVLERLTKEQEEVANGPCNLLEYSGLRTLYRKNLTPYAWGVVVTEAAHWLNMLEGGAQRPMIRGDHLSRTTLACMVREMGIVLSKASRASSWEPKMDASSQLGSVWALEMLYACPTWMVRPFMYLADLTIDQPFPSSALIDILAGRRSTALSVLSETLDLASRLKVEVPVCTHVQQCLKELEDIPGTSVTRTYRTDLIDKVYRRGREPASVAEFRGYAYRVAAIISFALLFYVLFLH